MEIQEVKARIQEFKEALEAKFGGKFYAPHGGRRFQKIEHGTHVYCFVDLTNGDVLKAESYKKPAMHARSNIFAEDFGLSGVNEYGANYLK